MTDPKRWIDDPAAPDALRADLQSVVDHPPAVPLPASLPTTPGGGATGSAALIGGGALVLLVGIGLWVAGPSASEPSVAGVSESEQGRADDVPAHVESAAGDNREVSAVEAAHPSEMAGANTATSATLENAHSDLGQAGAPQGDAVQRDSPQGDAVRGNSVRGDSVSGDSVQRAAIPEVRSRAARSTEPAPSMDDEIAHLAALRRAGGNPALALRLAREGERRFRGGLFGEERQAIVALSLYALPGRLDEATRAARAFLARYPGSTFRRSIEEILTASEGSPSTGHQRP